MVHHSFSYAVSCKLPVDAVCLELASEAIGCPHLSFKQYAFSIRLLSDCRMRYADLIWLVKRRIPPFFFKNVKEP